MFSGSIKKEQTEHCLVSVMIPVYFRYRNFDAVHIFAYSRTLLRWSAVVLFSSGHYQKVPALMKDVFMYMCKCFETIQVQPYDFLFIFSVILC